MSERDKKLVKDFYSGVGFEGLARRYGITRERVRQILKAQGIKAPRMTKATRERWK